MNKQGFTLLEVMVVVFIIAAMAAIALPKLASPNRKVKSEIHKLALLTRQVRNLAKLKHMTYRLVIDMQGNQDKGYKQSFWIESSTSSELVSQDRAQEIKDLYDAIQEARQNGKEYKSAQGFQKDTSVLKDKNELPSGMIFEDVELKSVSEPIKEGRVYIHFFPSGRVEEVAIHLQMDKIHWTLAIQPLTGRSDMITKYVSLKDFQQ